MLLSFYITSVSHVLFLSIDPSNFLGFSIWGIETERQIGYIYRKGLHGHKFICTPYQPNMAHIAHVYSIHLELDRYNLFVLFSRWYWHFSKEVWLENFDRLCLMMYHFTNIQVSFIIYYIYIYIWIFPRHVCTARKPPLLVASSPATCRHESVFGFVVWVLCCIYRYPVMVIIPGAYMFNEGSRDCDHPWEYFFCNWGFPWFWASCDVYFKLPIAWKKTYWLHKPVDLILSGILRGSWWGRFQPDV